MMRGCLYRLRDLKEREQHMLQIQNGTIVAAHLPGTPAVALRGAGVGGWMNMENFINGYPGAEGSLKATMSHILGANKTQFFFERLLDYFLSEDDIAFLKASGSTVVRLPLNYRHFEDDRYPFTYLEAGFQRLDRVLGWCAKYGLYAILDLHAVQGWQNTDWHSDNTSRNTLFWQHPHFQDRFVALWAEFARRYRDNEIIAAYDIMNEPVTNAPYGLFSFNYTPDWEILNTIYRRAVRAIRSAGDQHIIFLEGDLFSTHFSQLEVNYADNLAYSSHNYTDAGFGPGIYPGTINGREWNRDTQMELFLATEGVHYARQRNVPLWVGEFGSVINGPIEEEPDRLRALDDQLATFNQCNAHWTAWTYKDVGVMGWVTLDPASDYMQVIAPILRTKRQLHTDFWMHWLSPTPIRQMTNELAHSIAEIADDPSLDTAANERFFTQAALDIYAGAILQRSFAECFKGMSDNEIDSILQSFAFHNCHPHTGLISVLQKNMQ